MCKLPLLPSWNLIRILGLCVTMTEEKLEQRLRELYRAAPAADPQRLAAILRQIEAAAPRSRRPLLVRQRWLPWLLLTCSVVAAAAAYRWHGGQAPQPPATTSARKPAATIHSGPARAREPAAAPHHRSLSAPHSEDKPSAGRRGTVIYMR